MLFICGPTGVGKTAFSLKVAKKFNGEIISADSRQVYIGLNIISGKDLPPSSQLRVSGLKWRDRLLKYYSVYGTNIWLYDIVYPNEPFNVSYWHDCAQLVIDQLKSNSQLAIIVGGSGLYIKSLSTSLDQISIPPNFSLRSKLEHHSSEYLFNYLNKLYPSAAAVINCSDKHNPRRLIRYIEIAGSNVKPKNPLLITKPSDNLFIGLTAPREILISRVHQRIKDRLAKGAQIEAKKLIKSYGSNLPCFSACGFSALFSENPEQEWLKSEKSYLRRQLTWFKKQPNINWFDITVNNWEQSALCFIQEWYNKKYKNDPKN